MPTLKFDAKAESIQFELLPNGDYPFEIVAVDVGISTGRKTGGSDIVEMKVSFFADATFTKKRAQWTEDLIFHPSCAWKVSVFTKCANMLLDGKTPPDGAELDYSADTMIGLRGWATVGFDIHSEDKNKPVIEQRRYNKVVVWLTNKEKLPRNTPEVDPFADEPSKPF